jgi:methionyl-tRNA formyltransferase
MGTPEFSVPALHHLALQEDFTVCLIVTQPDRRKGRGKKFMPSPVKEAASELGLEVYQPEKINTGEAENKLISLEPDFFVVAAFGQILSQKILDIPKIYPINIHASLLPKYRGPSPIQAAILNMDNLTGVTTMVMSKEMDKGDILLSKSTPISENDTAEDLHDRLGKIGAELIVDTIRAVLSKECSPVPQDHSKATYVNMLKKSDGKINWNLSSRQVHAHINAMTPWPGAFSSLGDKVIKIFKAVAMETPCSYAPGIIFFCDKDGIHVSTGKGSLIIQELMGASGKRLRAAEYLCGHPIVPPAKFDF